MGLSKEVDKSLWKSCKINAFNLESRKPERGNGKTSRRLK